MSTLPFLSPATHAGIRNANPGDLIELIFASHRLAQLHVSEGRCLCGVLTGPTYKPLSHSTLLCPIARYYSAVDAMDITKEPVSPAADPVRAEFNEPWAAAAVVNYSDDCLVDASGDSVALAFPNKPPSQRESIAARIATCINFCTGMPSGSLTKKGGRS